MKNFFEAHWYWTTLKLVMFIGLILLASHEVYGIIEYLKYQPHTADAQNASAGLFTLIIYMFSKTGEALSPFLHFLVLIFLIAEGILLISLSIITRFVVKERLWTAVLISGLSLFWLAYFAQEGNFSWVVLLPVGILAVALTALFSKPREVLIVPSSKPKD